MIVHFCDVKITSHKNRIEQLELKEENIYKIDWYEKAFFIS